MRYAFLTFEFPPDHGGGLSTYMGHTLRMLRQAGEQAWVIVVDNTVTDRRVDRFEGFDVLRVNVVSRPICRTLGYWAAASHVMADALAQAIDSFGRPDIVEICDGFGLGYFTLQRKWTLEPPFRDLRICVTAHTPCSLIDRWDGQNWHALPRYWIREAELFCLKAADVVLAPSHFLVGELRRDFECADLPITVVRNPYEAAAPAAPASASPEPCYVFGSRLAGWKGPLELVRAFDLYWKQGGAASLRLFGADAESPAANGSVSAFLRARYAGPIEQGRLQIPGLVPPARLAQEKRAARALLHPSHKENFPYTVIEHMAAGGIAAASRSGGQAELIEDGASGFLFDVTDPAQIVEALHRCDALDDRQRAAMGRQAAARVQALCAYPTVHAAKSAALRQPRTTVGFPFLRGEEVSFAPAPPAAGPRLSVVVPYFNLPDLVRETVRSALDSECRDLEVIVVDDGSTDAASPAVLAELEGWERVRVLHKPNAGVAEARNFGVAAARGELVALLDADDLVTPTYYTRCIAILDRYPNVGFVGCWNEDFDERGTIRHWPTFNPEPPMQLIFNTTNCQGLVLRREAFQAAGGHDRGLGMFLDDWEATIAMLVRGIRGVMIPHPLFRYRVRQGSIFRSRADRWAANYDYIVRKHAAAYAHHAPEIIAFLNANGPNPDYHNPTFPSPRAAAGGAADPFAAGRLYRLVRAYYLFTTRYRSGRRLRRLLAPLTPLVDLLLTGVYRVRRRLG